MRQTHLAGEKIFVDLAGRRLAGDRPAILGGPDDFLLSARIGNGSASGLADEQ
jgi:hypothetical protein